MSWGAGALLALPPRLFHFLLLHLSTLLALIVLPLLIACATQPKKPRQGSGTRGLLHSPRSSSSSDRKRRRKVPSRARSSALSTSGGTNIAASQEMVPQKAETLLPVNLGETTEEAPPGHTPMPGARRRVRLIQPHMILQCRPEQRIRTPPDVDVSLVDITDDTLRFVDSIRTEDVETILPERFPQREASEYLRTAEENSRLSDEESEEETIVAYPSTAADQNYGLPLQDVKQACEEPRA